MDAESFSGAQRHNNNNGAQLQRHNKNSSEYISVGFDCQSTVLAEFYIIIIQSTSPLLRHATTNATIDVNGGDVKHMVGLS